jgi:hypothetical protein
MAAEEINSFQRQAVHNCLGTAPLPKLYFKMNDVIKQDGRDDDLIKKNAGVP